MSKTEWYKIVCTDLALTLMYSSRESSESEKPVVLVRIS
jgi:hypothetical protein